MSYIRGSSGNVTSIPLGEVLVNNTGNSFAKLIPICINPTTGLIDTVDVSNEFKARTVYAITTEIVGPSSSGVFITSGRIENVLVNGTYGSPVYVSKIGTLTTTYPAVGSNGFLSKDFIIEVGFLAKNTKDSSKIDLIVKIQQPVQLE